MFSECAIAGMQSWLPHLISKCYPSTWYCMYEYADISLMFNM